MPPHPLINFEIQKYYQNEPRFNGVYSIDNLPKKIKDGAYVINLDEHSHAGMHWIALYCKNIEIICFVSFGVEHVRKEIEKLIGQKNKKNIFTLQTIQKCVDTLALDLSILYLQVKLWLILLQLWTK